MKRRRYLAGAATYPGDARHMVGEVKGPTTYGGLVVAVEAQHDGARTRVAFAHCGDTDHEVIAKTGRARLDFALLSRTDTAGGVDIVEAAQW